MGCKVENYTVHFIRVENTAVILTVTVILKLFTVSIHSVAQPAMCSLHTGFGKCLVIENNLYGAFET